MRPHYVYGSTRGGPADKQAQHTHTKMVRRRPAWDGALKDQESYRLTAAEQDRRRQTFISNNRQPIAYLHRPPKRERQRKGSSRLLMLVADYFLIWFRSTDRGCCSNTQETPCIDWVRRPYIIGLITGVEANWEACRSQVN